VTLAVKTLTALVALLVGWAMMSLAYDKPEWYLQFTGIAGAVMTLGALYWWCAAIYRELRGDR
jgi:hypothetical protein